MGQVPKTYKIDQAATFAGVALLSVGPKAAFGSTEQNRTSEGVPTWEAQLVAGFHQFGKINNEILKVGVVAYTNPGDGLAPYTPVELVGFEVGVMEKKDRDGQVVGVQVWYGGPAGNGSQRQSPRYPQLSQHRPNSGVTRHWGHSLTVLHNHVPSLDCEQRNTNDRGEAARCRSVLLTKVPSAF